MAGIFHICGVTAIGKLVCAQDACIGSARTRNPGLDGARPSTDRRSSRTLEGHGLSWPGLRAYALSTARILTTGRAAALDLENPSQEGP